MSKENLTKEELDQLAILEFKIDEEGYLEAEDYARYIELRDKLDGPLLEP